MTRRILFISNGHGEDSIAAEIIRRLPPSTVAEAYPTLGSGEALSRVAPLVGPRARLASQGSRAHRNSLARDVARGGLMTVPPGLLFLRRVRGHYDHVVVVGDLLGVLGCAIAGIRGITYVDVYRSGTGRPYRPIELRLMQRTCARVFTRHEALAAQLRAVGVEAVAAGNVMMDTIPRGDYDGDSRRERESALLLLPGSRAEAPTSFALQIEALTHLRQSEMPDLFLALADGIDPATLAAAAGLRYQGPMTSDPGDGGTMSGPVLIHMGRGVLGNLLDQADIVLSQAGTATIQAIGSGKPVLTVRDPRLRKSRADDLAALFGDARQVLPPDPAEIAVALSALLSDPAERARRGWVGRERIGGPGAIETIVAAIAGQGPA